MYRFPPWSPLLSSPVSRDPQASDLWRLLDEVYDERYQAKYGGGPACESRPIVQQSVAGFLKCGDLQEGFAPKRS